MGLCIPVLAWLAMTKFVPDTADTLVVTNSGILAYYDHRI
jgi:uncharacterized membrane protein YkgB